jgi:hypothetical protein
MASFSAFVNDLLFPSSSAETSRPTSGQAANTPSSFRSSSEPGHSPPTVQSLTFLPHHLDPPSAPAQPKHFALVVLPSPAIAQAFLNDWPWNRGGASSSILSSKTHDPANALAPETNRARTQIVVQKQCQDALDAAIKSGLRAISKAQWKEMGDMYLAHRERILSLLAATDGAGEEEDAYHPTSFDDHGFSKPTLDFHPTTGGNDANTDAHTNVEADDKFTQTRSEEDMYQGAEPGLDPNAPYPPNCLLFVRNVHTGTNKTTLRTLFERFLDGEGVDYVDYVKGGDSVSFLSFDQQTKQKKRTYYVSLLLVSHPATHP